MRASISVIFLTFLIAISVSRPAKGRDETYGDPPANEYQEEGSEYDQDDTSSDMLSANNPSGVSENLPIEQVTSNQIEDPACKNESHNVKSRNVLDTNMQTADGEQSNMDNEYSDGTDADILNDIKHFTNTNKDAEKNKSTAATPKNPIVKSVKISGGVTENNVKNEFNNLQDNRRSNNNYNTNDLSQEQVNNDIENDEKIIKRQIKMLTKQELDELFGSLSKPKRQLLKKIIDSPMDEDKREINEKSGAVQNLQEFAAKLNDDGRKSRQIITDNVALQGEDLKDDSKVAQSANTLVSYNKNIKSDKLANAKDKSPKNKSENIINMTMYEPLKDKMKRNVVDDQNSSEEPNQDYYEEEENPCSSILNEIENKEKREASHESDDLSDALKSLADSFPRSNEVDTDFTPHVRVKRKNMNIKNKATYALDPVPSCVPHEQTYVNFEDEGKEFDNNYKDLTAFINESVTEKLTDDITVIQDDASKSDTKKAAVKTDVEENQLERKSKTKYDAAQNKNQI